MFTTHFSRRAALKIFGAGALMTMTNPTASPAATPLAKRVIPKSGEALPVIGLGTYQVFDVAPRAPELVELQEVLTAFVAGGASLIDSSPMYGRAEAVTGELSAALGLQARLFLATKVWTRGRQAGVRQMQDSLRLMRTRRIDLMQVHNLLDLETHLTTLREWKAADTLRYIGITHYHAGAYRELEKLLATRDYDFVQFNYSLAEREAEQRLLAVAAESGTAVIINRPFAQGELFSKVRGRELPAWAADFDCTSWAQFFLKYIIAHPAVTCVIPGTGKVRHMTDNLKAGAGRLPDARHAQAHARTRAGASRCAAYRPVLLLLSAVLGACSGLRLAYPHADMILGWRANTYFDLDHDQRRDFSARLDRLLAWHRYDQLPEYASFLTAAIDKAEHGVTPEDIAWFVDGFRARYRVVVNRGVERCGRDIGNADARTNRRIAKTVRQGQPEIRERVRTRRGQRKAQARAAEEERSVRSKTGPAT